MSVINGDLTQDNGSFTIAPTGLGKFKLKIESIGITPKIVDVEVTSDAPDKNLGKIKLDRSSTSLKEVDIVGEKPVMELKVDKKVFNVEKNTTSAGGSASDVLQNVPSVSVDADGNVSLRGKQDVTILIDGKPATMLGSDVASALASLPAGSIENVEVITNPSAKYDAQGTSGIINIVTKKDGRFGINGNATLGYGTFDKYNGNFGINAHKGKWNVFANGSFRLNSTYNNVTTERDNRANNYVTQVFNTYEHVPRHQDGSFNSIGATYEPNKFNSFTISENINIMHFGFADYATDSVFSLTQLPQKLLSNVGKTSDFDVNLLSLSSSLDYKKKFNKKDEELSVDVTYATTDIRRSQNITSIESTDSGSTSAPRNIVEAAPATGNNSTLTAWADYSDPLFTKNGKLGLGFKSQLYSFTSNGSPTIKIDGSSASVDSSLLANYSFTTQTNAAYINWNDQLGKFSYQVGVRGESVKYDGNGNVPKDTSFHSSFLNLFPSAFISYQLPNQQSVFLNYSRRTNYPDFRSLLPFKDFSNPGTVNMGNPTLIPEFINNLEFSYSKSTTRGDNFILSVYYAQTQNLTQRVTRGITASHTDTALGLQTHIGELLTQPVNIASGTTYGLEGTGHIQIRKWWDATLNFNLFQNNLVIGNADPAYDQYLTNNSGFSWFGKVNTSIKLPKSFSLQINGNYESGKVIAQGNLKETYWVDVALRKNLWKNKATIILNCSDIFNTHRFYTVYDQPAYYETINRVKETRIGNITFTYRFGKTDMGKQGGSKKMKPEDKPKQVTPTDKDRTNNMKDGEDGGGEGGGGQKQGGKN